MFFALVRLLYNCPSTLGDLSEVSVMSRKSLVAQSLIASLLLSSLVAVPQPVRANDLVPSDDLVGGTSVFVFRGSSKKPQGGGGSRTTSTFVMRGARPAMISRK